MGSNFVDSQSQSQNNHTIETSSETLAHPGCSDRTQKQEISTHSDHQDCADDANGRSISEIPATNLASNDQNLEKKGNEHVENAATSLKQVILKPLLSEPNTQSGTDKDCSGGEEETTSRRRRKSRWDSDGASSDGTGTGTRKRKSRWADDPKPVIQLPDFMNFTAGIEFDPEIQVLNSRLLEISRKFQSGLPLDDRPEGARSPSPEPVYDNMGIRINTREFRARERLTRERQEIISQIIKKNPAFKPPADYRPPKLHKKLYIPMKEYPGYNFIGLIIGPRGNTQKRMEKESGAKIVIRGKGSVKEGRLLQKRDLKHDPSENEDLHVLVEAETQEALDAAAGMVEKLLQPVDEVLNEHKRQQLKELAALNGTTRDEEYCKLCGESGHRQYACPSRTSTFRSDVLCKICGDGGHPTIDCPVKGTTGNKMDEEYRNFLAELGGTVPESSTKQNGATLALGPGSCGSNSSLGSDNSTSVTVGISQAGLGTLGTKLIKENDETNLYIGYLPPSLDDDGLISLFSPFGVIVMAKVIKDRVTGLSKGYGFVKYSDVQQATSAIASMNGYQLDGRSIAVRVAGKPPPPAVPPATPVGPTPTIGMNQVGGVYPTQQFSPTTPIGIAPPVIPVNCAGIPVPWAPAAPVVPVAPIPYAPYPPPPPPPPLPPGSAMYTTVLPGQPIVPYGVQCPPSTNAAATGIATQTPAVGETPYASSTEIQQTFPPGVQSQISASVHPVPTYIQDNPITAVPPTAQPAYPAPSSVYPPYYGAVPPPPLPTTTVDPLSIVDQSLSLGNVPWASKPPVPMSSAEKTNPSVDAKYESKGDMK